MPEVTQPVGLVENYVVGRAVIHLHCHWWNWVRPVEVKNLCACFCGLFTVVEPTCVNAILRECGTGYGAPVIEDENGAMFVDVVELSEEPQGIGLRRAGISLVWLRFLKGCEEVGGSRPERRDEHRQRLDAVVQKIRLRMADWKPHITDRLEIVEFCKEQVRDEMVQAGAHLMNRIPEHQIGFSRNLRDAGIELDVCPLGLVMKVANIRARFRCSRSEAEFGFEVVEMTVRPSNLAANILKCG